MRMHLGFLSMAWHDFIASVSISPSNQRANRYVATGGISNRRLGRFKSVMSSTHISELPLSITFTPGLLTLSGGVAAGAEPQLKTVTPFCEPKSHSFYFQSRLSCVCIYNAPPSAVCLPRPPTIRS